MTDPPPPGAGGRLVGVPEDVAPGVRRILAPNPGLMTGPGTNTYLIGDGPLAVIDPGPDDDAHLVAILDAVGDRLRFVVATHTHVDHSPLSRRLREATGAEVLGFGPAPVLPAHTHHHPDGGAGGGGDGGGEDGDGGGGAGGGGDGGGGDGGGEDGAAAHGPADAHDLDFAPQRRLGDGDTVRVGDLTLTAVHTPGHCSNHLCLELAGSGLLLSGDHVMSGSTVVVAPPDGDMAAYLESLEKVRRRHPTRIAPGHGAMIDDPAAALDDYLSHRRSRERQVLDGVAAAGAGTTPEALVAAIYVDVPAALHPVARWSVWAHLRKLGDEGKVRSDDPDDVAATWRPT